MSEDAGAAARGRAEGETVRASSEAGREGKAKPAGALDPAKTGGPRRADGERHGSDPALRATARAGTATVRLLVTGFGAFPGAPRNPTERLVARLAARRDWARQGVACHARVLPVTWAGVEDALRAAMDEARPDAVLLLGLAGNADRLRVETRAMNRRAARRDADGQRPPAGPLARGAPSARPSRADGAALVAALRAAGLPAARSIDAGGCLCNAALWHALDRAPPAAPVVFLHVPRRFPGGDAARDRARLEQGALIVARRLVREARRARTRPADAP